MTTQYVIEQVADFFKTPSEDIMAATKSPNRIYRQIAIYLCTKHTVCTYETLCVDFGLKSKSAIARAVSNVNNFKGNYVPVSSVMDELEQKVKGGKAA